MFRELKGLLKACWFLRTQSLGLTKTLVAQGGRTEFEEANELSVTLV